MGPSSALRDGLGDPLLREVLDAMESSDFEATPYDPAPVLHAESIAAALVDSEGRVLCASSAFEAIGGERLLDPDMLARARDGAPGAAVVGFADGDSHDTAVVAYAYAARAAAWRLPPLVKAAAAASPRAVVVLTCHAGGRFAPYETVCRAHGLSGLQTRVVIATIHTGQVRTAAAVVGVSFHTAREALAEAMRRVGVTRTPALVERITSLAFGVLPTSESADILTDVWGLTARQGSVAALLASGMTRKDAARALSVSEAVVKKRTDEVYQVLQVATAAALARKVVEARALRWLTDVTGGDLGFMDTGAEPLQFVPRPRAIGGLLEPPIAQDPGLETSHSSRRDRPNPSGEWLGGGRIAVSDHGPASGRPVLVSHTLMSTRPIPRALVRALRDAGYRPIAIDRPGYGLTDEVEGARPGEHDPYATAAADVVLVMDHFEIPQFDLVVRVSAGLALALQASVPERLARVVLVNPGLPLSHDRRRRGPFGIAKDAYARNPTMPRILIRALSHALTFNRFVSAMRALVRGSPPDEMAVENPELMRDYFRAQRMFATGRLAGVLNEQLEYTRGSRPPPVPGTREWRILVGAHDTLHNPSDVLAYWRALLPDAPWRLADDAGRLMAFTHPHLIVEALQAPDASMGGTAPTG